MRERIGYSNFVDKYGKVIFPISFVLLFAGFISPLTINNWFIKMGLISNVMEYSFFSYIPAIVTAPIYYLKTNYSEMQSYYGSFDEYMKDMLPSFSLSIAIICCTIAFFVLYFAKHKTNKGLLIAIPSLYIVMTIVLCAVTKGIPFVGFYTTLIFLIFAILYCANAQLLPKPRQHKLTKSERIAELEKQVAELTKEKDTH